MSIDTSAALWKWDRVDATTFSERLRLLRNRRGLTQQQLADQVGVTKTTISRWEKASGNRPYGHNLTALAQALGSTPTFLVDGTEGTGPSPQAEAARKYVSRSKAGGEVAGFLEDVAELLERRGRTPDEHFYPMLALAFGAHSKAR